MLLEWRLQLWEELAMENNQPETEPNVMQVNTVSPNPEPKKGNSAIWLIVIVVVAVALVIGVFWYMRGQTTVPQTAPATSSSSLNDLTSELNNADDTSLGADLNQLDQDLQAL